MADVCPDCGRPFAENKEQWWANTHCGHGLSRVDENNSDLIAAECYEKALDKANDRIRALESQLAASNAKVHQFMSCADALEDLAEERDPVRCLAAKGLEFTYECPTNAPCLACRVRHRIEKVESELAEANRKREWTEQWYAERHELLWHWAHEDKEHRGGYFQIAANGSEHGKPPTYAQLLNMAKHRADKAESELTSARTTIADLSYQLGKSQGEAEGHRLVRVGLEAELAELAELRKREEWIPVADRLPEFGVVVLVAGGAAYFDGKRRLQLSRSPVSDAELFLLAVRDLVTERKIDLALRIIMRWCDAQFRGAGFGRVSEALDIVDTGALPGDIVVGLLSATYPATAQLGPSRKRFVELARARLMTEFGASRTESILSRLA